MICRLATTLLLASLQTPPSPSDAVPRLQREARALAPLVNTRLARDFLDATSTLPRIAPRQLFRSEDRTRYRTEADPAAERAGLVPFPVDESFYYNTKYGTPLAYVRPLEVLAQAGVVDLGGKRVLDFGAGGIGPPRLLAGLGADVIGVDVDPLLPALYSWPGDQGAVAAQDGRSGRVRLVHGRYPADGAVRAQVGTDFDLIISKNTLKRGYIHPERAADPRRLIDLGVDDTAFLAALHGALRPGGFVLIYNLAPAQAPADQPFLPAADGRSPFTQEQWQTAGFSVRMFDQDDSPAARAMGRALGWDQTDPPMDLEKGLFATVTLVQKPAVDQPPTP